MQNQLEAAIDRAAIGAYFETVFANLETVKADVTKAADGGRPSSPPARTPRSKGATDLAAGITTAQRRLRRSWSPGLADAKAGSTQLVTGTGRRQGRVGVVWSPG